MSAATSIGGRADPSSLRFLGMTCLGGVLILQDQGTTHVRVVSHFDFFSELRLVGEDAKLSSCRKAQRENGDRQTR